MLEPALGRLDFSERLEDDKDLEEMPMSWNQVAGKKKKTTMAFAKSKWNMIKLICFAISDEPARYLTQTHFHFCYKLLAFFPDRPTTFETYANDRRSPIYSAFVGCLEFGGSKGL